jgi:hypothetical protein
VSELDSLRSSLLEREQELETLQREQNQRKVELESSVSRMNEMVKRLTGESEKSALAVQKAISSSVRLCVVAPTVNVHVADKKMKFRSRYPSPPLPRSSSAACPGSLSRNSWSRTFFPNTLSSSSRRQTLSRPMV